MPTKKQMFSSHFESGYNVRGSSMPKNYNSIQKLTGKKIGHFKYDKENEDFKLIVNPMYKNHTACRVCGSTKLTEYLDLGMMPLSNSLMDTPGQEIDRYPLKVLLCEDCSLSQLSIVIDPETLFGHYVYRSSISQGYKDHCRQMAKDLKQRHNLTADSFHIDIAGNDGALLKEFKEEIGHKVLNVDPATNLVKINEDQGIRMFNTFWGRSAVNHLKDTGWPKADLITATNVFAHVDDVKEFILAAKMILKPGGVLVMEFPYLIDFIEKTEFDTIYFEHLSYFSIGPLAVLCDKVGMSIKSIEHFKIHGGSMRITIGEYEPARLFLSEAATKEVMSGYLDLKTYQDFAKKVKIVITNFRHRIKDLKAQGYNIAAFAASAKGNTLLNCAGITSKEIDYIIDETPEKIGKFSPGTGIPIRGLQEWNLQVVDYMVILSWNFSDEIIAKCRAAGYTGKFILPLTFEII